MKIDHEETKSAKKDQKQSLRALRFFVVDFSQEQDMKQQGRLRYSQPPLRLLSLNRGNQD
jgi:hypothetical protein